MTTPQNKNFITRVSTNNNTTRTDIGVRIDISPRIILGCVCMIMMMIDYYNLVMNYCNSLIDYGTAKNWKDQIIIYNITQSDINLYYNPDKYVLDIIGLY